MVQSDWNQNDATQPGYIKNRPFYDIPVIQSETANIELTYGGEGYFDGPFSIEEGTSNYTINGELAEIITINTGDSTVQGLESASWVQRYHSGIILWYQKTSGDSTALTIVYDKTLPTGNIKQIDEKYIPTQIDYGYNNTTNIPYTTRQGANNDATVKCYLINSYTQTTITLKSIEGIEVGMRWNIFYYKDGVINKIRGPILAIDASTNTLTISDGEIGIDGEPGITEDFEISTTPTFTGTFIVDGGTVGIYEIDDDTVNTFSAVLSGSGNFATIRSHVEGTNNKVLGFSSHAEGKGAIVRGEYAHAEGYKSQAKGHASHAENFEAKANGAYSHAEGAESQSNGPFSHAEGRLTQSNAQSSHSEGESTEASGFAAHAEGNKTVASGSYAHAEGYDNKATGRGSHAEGEGNTVSGTDAHAEGRLNTASGYSSHAEGQSTTASAVRAHAEGYSTKATADDSHAEGNFCEANGINSHAEGKGTKANGLCSHAQGRDTYADGENQHVAGKNNIRDTENKYVEIIGNGAASTNRSNARTLDWNGNAWYAGEVRVGKNNTKLIDERDLNEVKNELGAINYFATEASQMRPKQDLEFKSVTIQLNNGSPEIVMEFNAAAYFNNTVTNAFIRNDKVGNAFQLIQNEVIYEDGFTYGGKDFATRIRIAFRASGGAASTYTDLAELYDSGLMFFNIIEYNGGFTHTDGYMSAEQIIDIYGNLMPRNYTITSGDYPVRYTNFFEDITDRTQLVGLTSHTITYDVKEIGLVDENSLNEAISNSVADWNQNDENAPNYVKNRTHYIGTTTALEQKTETYNVSTSYGSPGEVSPGKYGYFVDNDTLDTIVSSTRSNYTINGEAATIITVPEYHNSLTGEIGASFQGLQSANYKFVWLRGCGGYCIHRGIESSTEETSFTITYDEEAEVPYYHPLDEKFIPDTIARTSIIKDLSNALKGNKSGAVVACDVSPIEHTLKVKARRKNLFDISKVINDADIQVGTGAKITATNNVLSDFIAIPPNTAFVGNFIRHCAFYDINKNYISDIGSKSATTKRALTTPSNAYYMRFSYQTGVTDGSNIQIELGTTETPYTPYIADITTAKVIVNGSQTYPINADGTVEGITSLYPTTTLTTDTEGIVLDVEYNRDINSAFAELTQAIISLGGSI